MSGEFFGGKYDEAYKALLTTTYPLKAYPRHPFKQHPNERKHAHVKPWSPNQLTMNLNSKVRGTNPAVARYSFRALDL